MSKPTKRYGLSQLRLSEEDDAKLDRVASELGQNRAEAVRTCIRTAWQGFVNMSPDGVTLTAFDEARKNAGITGLRTLWKGERLAIVDSRGPCDHDWIPTHASVAWAYQCARCEAKGFLTDQIGRLGSGTDRGQGAA